MSAYRERVVKQLLLTLWGMATLVLLFCVGLLVYQMIQQGQDPLEGLRAAPGEAGIEAAQPAETPGASGEVTLYFASPDGSALSPERRAIELTPYTSENCRNALNALVAGPRSGLTPILPGNTQVRALYLLEDGELVIDLSRELLAEHARFSSASLECLMFYGIVNTLTQPAMKGEREPAVKKVRFLFEGGAPQDFFPAHLDLSDPILPDTRWLASMQGAGGNA